MFTAVTDLIIYRSKLVPNSQRRKLYHYQLLRRPISISEAAHGDEPSIISILYYSDAVPMLPSCIVCSVWGSNHCRGAAAFPVLYLCVHMHQPWLCIELWPAALKLAAFVLLVIYGIMKHWCCAASLPVEFDLTPCHAEPHQLCWYCKTLRAPDCSLSLSLVKYP